jgi:hypothetical protein
MARLLELLTCQVFPIESSGVKVGTWLGALTRGPILSYPLEIARRPRTVVGLRTEYLISRR